MSGCENIKSGYKMNDIQIFKNSAFGEVRVTEVDGEPMFCLADVCKMLDLGNPSQVKSRLSDGVISNEVILDSLGREQVAAFINEDALYDVIFDSRKPEARAFRKWVTSEVLPAIRKTGGYIATKKDDTPELIMARALMVAKDTIDRAQDRIRSLEAENAVNAPKALFADAVASSDRSCLISELAKILRQNGVNIGQNRLFAWMRDNGFLCSKGEYYNQPTQRAMEMGLFEIKKTSITKPDGSVLVTTTTKVTGKGQIYFVNKFLSAQAVA